VIKDKNRDIEIRLRSIKLRPAPAGLRDRVLEAAEQNKTQNSVMPPLLWRSVACCTLILAFVLGLDAFLAGRQTRHFQSYLDGNRFLQGAPDMGWLELAKDLDEPAGSGLLGQVKRLLAAQTKIRHEPVGRSLAKTSQEVF